MEMFSPELKVLWDGAAGKSVRLAWILPKLDGGRAMGSLDSEFAEFVGLELE